MNKQGVILAVVAGLATLGLGLGLGRALAQPAQPAKPALTGAAEHGRKLFTADGCYQCHGFQGQGGGVAGPKLAPNPLPIDAFASQLRNPRDRMPIYTHVVLPDANLNDIYAYVQSIPKAHTVAEIPLLSQ
jgi:ubiquinol-cytochrome c reductase cytochrome c subunit